MPVAELISEAITPVPGAFDTVAMSRGEPGLPKAFDWRDNRFRVVEVLDRWKQSSAEGGTGERYLRRHCYRLKMDDDSVWIVYFTRQSPKGASPRTARQRWFMYTLEVAPAS